MRKRNPVFKSILGGIVIVATHLPIKIEDSMVLRLPPRFPRRLTLVDMLDRADI